MDRLDARVTGKFLVWAYYEAPVSEELAGLLREALLLPFEDPALMRDTTTVWRRHAQQDSEHRAGNIRCALLCSRVLEWSIIGVPSVSVAAAKQFMRIITQYARTGLTYSKTGDSIIHQYIQLSMTAASAAEIAVGTAPYDALSAEHPEAAERIVSEASSRWQYTLLYGLMRVCVGCDSVSCGHFGSLQCGNQHRGNLWSLCLHCCGRAVGWYSTTNQGQLADRYSQ